MKKKVIISISLLLLLLGGAFLFVFYKEQEAKDRQKKLEQDQRQQEKIEKAYAPFVEVTNDATLYQKQGEIFQEVGTAYKGMQFELFDEEITSQTKYFHIKGYDLYIPYQFVKKVENLTVNTRYQHYLPLESVTVKQGTNLEISGKIKLQLPDKIQGKVYQKKGNIHYVEYQNQLFEVSEESLENIQKLEVVDAAERIPVLVYHFIYLNGEECNESICFHEDQIRSHFSYLKEANVFTMNTDEMKAFIKGEIELPKKSVLITIDDGARAEKFIPFLEEYGLNATLFLITSWYNKEDFLSPYLEVASHGHDLHNPGVCPGGQGGGIKCLDEATIQKDLRLSREELDNSTAFCYPFYEYNDYAIDQLKKAGFEIAFRGGMTKVTKGTDLFRVPRISLDRTTTKEEVQQIIEG